MDIFENKYFINGLIIYIILYSSFGNFKKIIFLFDSIYFKIILVLLLLIFSLKNYILGLSFMILILLINFEKQNNKKKLSKNTIINSLIYAHLLKINNI